MSLALLLPARSADRKKNLLPFGRRGGVESGLLNAPRFASLLCEPPELQPRQLARPLALRNGPIFLAAAREALRYERNHFRPAEGNWPDLRSFVQPAHGGEPPCMLAWCHGAPGIGFARLRIRQLLPNEEGILSEAETAVETTARALTGAGLGNFSLCHGDGGNADMLLLAADLSTGPGCDSRSKPPHWPPSIVSKHPVFLGPAVYRTPA